MKPFEQPDGTVSRDHQYLLFRKDGEERVCAVPNVALRTVAIAACQAMLPGWEYVELNDCMYGQEPSEAEVDRWREDFRQCLRTSHFTTERADLLASA